MAIDSSVSATGADVPSPGAEGLTLSTSLDRATVEPGGKVTISATVHNSRSTPVVYEVSFDLVVGGDRHPALVSGTHRQDLDGRRQRPQAGRPRPNPRHRRDARSSLHDRPERHAGQLLEPQGSQRTRLTPIEYLR